MNNLTRLLILGAAATVSATLFAQPSGGPRGGPGGPMGRHGRHHGHPIVRAIDTEKDGVLSASELASASAAILTLDVNVDGTVSATELHPLPPNAPGRPANLNKPEKDATRPRPIDPVMLALDANSDGDLSPTEIANATTSLKALDDDEDGELTHDEFRPLPPE